MERKKGVTLHLPHQQQQEGILTNRLCLSSIPFCLLPIHLASHPLGKQGLLFCMRFMCSAIMGKYGNYQIGLETIFPHILLCN